MALSLQCNKALHNEVPQSGTKFHSDRNTVKRKGLWPSKFSGGLKAVAPTGSEHIIITIPEEEQQVSILGEKLSVDGREGTANYTSPGRAIAVISNVMIEYVPGPPPRTTKPPPTPPTTPPSTRKPAR